jgi:hypothetical protein
MAVEFKNQLQNTLQINIPVSVTFDYPTLKEVIYFLDEKISGQDRMLRTRKSQIRIQWQRIV